jgi:hypothetical protein
MRSLDTLGLPAAPPWSDADLVELTLRLANEPAAADVYGPVSAGAYGPTNEPAPSAMGPLSGRVGDRDRGVFRLSTAPADRGDRDSRSSTATDNPAWSVPLLVTAEVEAWLLGWPAGLVTAAHDHGRATVAVTVVEGNLSEECLDPTIWTTGRRTTWRAGASPSSRQATCTCSGRPATGRPWPSTPGAARPGQLAVVQAGLRLVEPPPVAGARVVAVVPPSPSGLAVVGVVAAAWLVIRRTALWILGTLGIG